MKSIWWTIAMLMLAAISLLANKAFAEGRTPQETGRSSAATAMVASGAATGDNGWHAIQALGSRAPIR